MISFEAPIGAHPALRPAPSLPQRGVLIIDDHDLVRLGVRALVHSQAAPGAEPDRVFEAASLAEGLAIYARHRASIQLVLLDLALPDADGLSGVAVFLCRFPAARLVVLSGTDDPTLMSGALSAGALSVLHKSADLKEVVSFIRACGLLYGQVPARDSERGPAEAARHVRARARPQANAPTRHGAAGSIGDTAADLAITRQQLTPRQSQVLQALLEGRSNRDIAQLAKLSEGTVKNHVSTLLLLFGMRSRAQLISSLR